MAFKGLCSEIYIYITTYSLINFVFINLFVNHGLLKKPQYRQSWEPEEWEREAISCWRHYRQLVLQSICFKPRQYRLFPSDRLYHSTKETMRYAVYTNIFYFISIKWKKHHNVCKDIKRVALINVTARDWLGLLWHFVAQQTKTDDLCCKLRLCNRATALPDVSEVILSQRLMEEYNPASNNSQPSCLLQGTITDLITCAVRTWRFTAL